MRVCVCVCVQRGMCAYECEIESLAGMNSCRFGVYIVLVSIFRGGRREGGVVQKPHCLVATIRFFSQVDFCGYCYCAYFIYI